GVTRKPSVTSRYCVEAAPQRLRPTPPPTIVTIGTLVPDEMNADDPSSTLTLETRPPDVWSVLLELLIVPPERAPARSFTLAAPRSVRTVPEICARSRSISPAVLRRTETSNWRGLRSSCSTADRICARFAL